MPEQKVALIFPGQGIDYSGADRIIYDISDITRAVYSKARELLSFTKSTVFPSSRLHGISQRLTVGRTDYAQVAIYVANHAVYFAMMEHLQGFRPTAVAGHSLGEYNALVASGAIGFEDALRLVEKRGKYMQQVSEKVKGGLVALIMRDEKSLNSLLGDLAHGEYVYRTESGEDGLYPALINSPNVLVVGGPKYYLKSHMGVLVKRAMRAIPLNVAGPFHTPYMKPAADLLKNEINSAPFKLAELTTVVANCSAEFIVDPVHIKAELIAQPFTPVQWLQSMRRMLEQGIDLYVVIGPDKTEAVKSWLNQIDRDAKVLTVMGRKSLEDVVQRLSE